MNVPYPRSDTVGSAVPGLATTLGTSYTYQDTDETNVKDYKTVTWELVISDKSTATQITLQALWSMESDPTLPTSEAALGDFGVQTSEEIAAGVGTETDFTAVYDISGKTASFPIIFTLPVAAPSVVLAVKADAGAPVVSSVKVWRGN